LGYYKGLFRLSRRSRGCPFVDLLFRKPEIFPLAWQYNSRENHDRSGTHDDADGRSLCRVRKSILRERTKAGLDAARKRSRIGGRRPKLRPDQQQEIGTMVSKGTRTAADAARLFNVHPATVLRILAIAAAE
jgi:hypothetical protein